MKKVYYKLVNQENLPPGNYRGSLLKISNQKGMIVITMKIGKRIPNVPRIA